MYFSYFFYFLIVFVVAIPMYLKKMYRQFSEALFTVSLTFYFCYIFFIIFPVAGPRFYFPGANIDKLNGYFFAKILKFVLDNAEIEGGAFPSSHVAVALQVLFFTHKYLKKIRIPFTIMFISLMISTVYGRFHYAVDVIGGIIVGIAFYLTAPKIRTLLGGERNIR